jgi:hypothetical protein
MLLSPVSLVPTAFSQRGGDIHFMSADQKRPVAPQLEFSSLAPQSVTVLPMPHPRHRPLTPATAHRARKHIRP